MSTGSSNIFRQIRESIINGEFHFNERLPSERDLADQFSAARGTIRTALEQLEQANLVRKKFGSGTFVSYNSQFEQEDIAEETSPLELIEARIAIEPHIVRLVISNANNRDIRKLEDALRGVMECQYNPNHFSSADEEFHLLLAHCTQNPLIIWIYQRINDIRSHSQWSHRKNHILTPRKIAAYNQQHKSLMEAIKSRDIEGASKLMEDHLLRAKADLLGNR
ncbi:MAG: FadR/GntR family transcriptional regulator [Pseudomonadota bacterium]